MKPISIKSKAIKRKKIGGCNNDNTNERKRLNLLCHFMAKNKNTGCGHAGWLAKLWGGITKSLIVCLIVWFGLVRS